MNATRHIEQEDLALYAMQLLPNDEAAATQQHIAECEACRRELGAVRADLGLYAQTVDLHAAPAQARERLLKQIVKEKKIVPISAATAPVAAAPSGENSAPQFGGTTGSLFGSAATGTSASYLLEDDPPRRSIAARILPWIGWAAAAGFAVTAGNFYHQRETLRTAITQQSVDVARLTADASAARQIMDTMTDSSALRVTLNRAQTAPVPQGRATYIADKGSLIFLASNMEPLQPSKTYELWIIPADGRDPVPAGTFRPDEHGNASVIMPPLPKGIPAKAFGVTVEDQGGSQTPTLPIIMVGA